MRLGWAAKCATLNGNEQMNCLVIVPTELFIDLNGLFATIQASLFVFVSLSACPCHSSLDTALPAADSSYT